MFVGGELAGQVGIIHSKDGWTPWAIRMITGSHWSHVIVAVNDVLCVSGEPGGALLKPIPSYTEIKWSRMELTDEQRDTVANWALRHVGVPYGWTAYYGAAVAAVLRNHTPQWLDRLVGRTDKLICSQIADLALQAAGINLFHDNRPRGAVTPASFGRYFFDHGWASSP